MTTREPTDPPTCRCGKPSHPCYGSRCEDCFAIDQGHGGETDPVRRRSHYAEGHRKMLKHIEMNEDGNTRE